MIDERNIKLVIAYDGTDFSGWQRQNDMRTVQGCIEEALRKMHKHPVTLYGAGRTDAGVHAEGQCANFHTGIRSINAGHFVYALNSLLPRDVRIRSAEEVPPDFHARFSAKSRRYRYKLICGMRNLPCESRYALELRRQPSITLLNDYARLLRGELDCALFASPSDPIFKRGSGSTHRFIHNALFFSQERGLVFEIRANAFFRRMVRSILGTLLSCEEKNAAPSYFERLLREGNHNKSGPTLCPKGLSLVELTY
jgi:tRNA pseudouridine38-40 synthase